MHALMAEREQTFPTAGRLPVAFRTLSCAKLQKKFKKKAFGENIYTFLGTNTILFVKKALPARQPIEDGERDSQKGFVVSREKRTFATSK